MGQLKKCKHLLILENLTLKLKYFFPFFIFKVLFLIIKLRFQEFKFKFFSVLFLMQKSDSKLIFTYNAIFKFLFSIKIYLFLLNTFYKFYHLIHFMLL